MVFISHCSASKYNVARECLLKFKRKYIQRIDPVFNEKRESADHLAWGSYIHRIFELGEDAKSIEDLRVIANEEKDNYSFHQKRLKDLNKILLNFFNFNNKIKTNSIGSEIEFEIHEEDTKLTNIGKIDRVVKGTEGRYLIIDYKTGRPKTRADLLRDPQLINYIFAICHLYRTEPEKVRVSHYYPHLDKFVDLQIPRQIYDNVRKKFKSDIWKFRKLKARDLKPKLNEFCDYCDWKDICPLFNSSKIINERLKKYFERKKVLEEVQNEVGLKEELKEE